MSKRLTAATFTLLLLSVSGVYAGQKQTEGADAQKSKALTAKTIKRSRHSKPVEPSAKQGKLLYKAYQCFDCHSIEGKGCKNGYSLDNIASKRSKDFIREHIKDPDKHFDKQQGSFDVDLNLMPPQNLEKWEIDSLVEYLQTLK